MLKDCFRRLRKEAAPGVDDVTYEAYAKNLEANLAHLVERLNRKSYHAQLVRRKLIPKGGGKLRPYAGGQAAATRGGPHSLGQFRWLSKPENVDYFRGVENAARVRAWRAAHPGYAKRLQLASPTLKELLPAKTHAIDAITKQGGAGALQETIVTQSPALVGLVAQLAGTALQDHVAEILRRIELRGKVLMQSGPAAFRWKPGA